MSTKTKIQWTELRGRALGVMKVAARKAGVSFVAYQAMVDSGLKYCWQYLREEERRERKN